MWSLRPTFTNLLGNFTGKCGCFLYLQSWTQLPWHLSTALLCIVGGSNTEARLWLCCCSGRTSSTLDWRVSHGSSLSASTSLTCGPHAREPLHDLCSGSLSNADIVRFSPSLFIYLFRRGYDYSVAFSETSFKWLTRGVLLPLHCTSIHSALWAWSSVYGDGLQHSLCTPFKALLMCSKACGLLDTTLPFARWRSCDASTSPMQMRPTTPPSRPHHLLFLYLSLSLWHTSTYTRTACALYRRASLSGWRKAALAGWEKERDRESESELI